jgi:hypothetical protein
MSISTSIKLPVISLRTITTELHPGKLSVAVINIKDLPEILWEWKTVNPRDADIASWVSKKIRESLTDNPEMFLFRNRWLTIIAESIEFDNKKNILKIELSNKEKHGLLDGGHTYKVIMDYLSENADKEGLGAFVKLELIERVEDSEIVSIVEARNTSSQVKDQSIAELNNLFEEIKKVLESKSYSNRIAYKEFELLEDGSEKDIDIKEILSYLICFDAWSFNDKNHPIKAYSSKKSVLDHFIANIESISKYIKLLPVILELRDIIYEELPWTYNSRWWKFWRLTWVTFLENKPRMDKTELRFIGKNSEYRIPNSFIYPILAAFRILVNDKNWNIEWKTDPLELFQELKEDLIIDRVCEQALKLWNPNKLWKDRLVWKSCYEGVEVATIRRWL